MTRYTREFVDDGGKTAAGRIAHEAKTAGRDQPSCSGQHARRVGHQFTGKAELFPGEHDGGAVIADGSCYDDPVARFDPMGSKAHAARTPAKACRGEIDAAALTPPNDLGIAGHDIHAGFFRGGGHVGDKPLQQFQFHAVFDNGVERQIARLGAADGQIVDGAVYGKGTDAPARKLERLDCEAVRGDHRYAVAVEVYVGGIEARVETRVAEAARERVVDQFAHQPSAVAMGERNVFVAPAHCLEPRAATSMIWPKLTAASFTGKRAGTCTSNPLSASWRVTASVSRRF